MNDDRANPAAATGPLRPDAADEVAKRRARALWEEDRAALLLEQPFVAQLALNLDIVPVVDCRLETASTDGRHLFVNPYFLDGLSQKERVFVLAHEVWHCALSHFGRETDGDHELWNVAFDHEVNAMLLDQGFTVPADAIYFEDLDGLNAETVYFLLKDRGERTDRGSLADQHPDDAHPTAAEGKLDPDYRPAPLDQETPRWPARVHDAAARLAATGQSLPPEVSRLLDRWKGPQLPWQALLERFVTRAACGRRTFLPPNRRFVSRGVYLPSRRTEALDIAVAIDTSASAQDDLPRFLGELTGILSSFSDHRIRVLQCDDAVRSDESYSADRPLDPAAVRLCGGGGTSFSPVFQHLDRTEKPSALIFFTDGYGDAPAEAPGYPVLWVLAPGGDSFCEWGEAVRMPAAPREG